MVVEKAMQKDEVSAKNWSDSKCDKYDYLISVFCGGVSGAIDVLLVGAPLTSVLGKGVDKAADKFVINVAQFLWKRDKRSLGRNKKEPQTLEQCISYLEQAFPVNYDARYSKDLVVEEGTLSGMSPKNHHLLSLAHSADLIGLFFSIINQFMGYASFVDNGRVIHVYTGKTSGAIPYMQGTDFISMLYCGFVNWIGHIISDLVGSSSTRRKENGGRGAGVAIPFYELFLFCDFGNFDGKTFAEVMTEVFENGYDARFGITMSIPVILNDLMIKVIWVIRQKFEKKNSWKECIPSDKHADLRIMLLVGNSTLCLIDGVDAAAHGIAEGNLISFICHLNIVGWARLVTLVLKELRIRYGPIIDRTINKFIADVMENIQTPAEKKRIYNFNKTLNEYNGQISYIYGCFIKQIECEYKEMENCIKEAADEGVPWNSRVDASIRIARRCNVSDNKIVSNVSELHERLGLKERR